MRSAFNSLILLLLAATSSASNIGAPIGPDGRVVDTPEVSIAKAEHAAAHLNQKINLANEAARSAGDSTGLDLQGAPIGPDGRVLDTPEVAAVKAAHAAAHVNEKIKLEDEAARSNAADSLTSFVPLPLLTYTRQSPFLTATLSPDGTVLDTPEVALARAAHAAAHVNERINLAREQAKSANAFGLNDVFLTGGFIY